ncbi:MAG: thermonuclease family protein [Candidatus Rokubacteria bacterium]|nr:thermonuclease family protein [Candidatus Rokubacteria bacterium]MBI2526545.1 thermonuclease family protein [Candidatus Rokubacteria bacterium]
MARALPARRPLLALAGALLAAALLWPTAGRPEPSRGIEGTVVRLVDGDTIHVAVEGRLEKVRYIGVNTPEIHHPRKGEQPGGRQAREVNRRLVEGRAVRLEPDVQQRDRYGRLLAYVWVRRDDGREVMVNAELLRLGYAQVMTIPPNVRYASAFLTLQRQAREANRGLWRMASP